MPTIKLFASLRRTAGQKEVPITGSTLISALNNLVQQVPALDEWIFENGQVRPQIIITINGRNVSDSNVPVAEDDMIAIFPPIAGG